MVLTSSLTGLRSSNMCSTRVPTAHTFVDDEHLTEIERDPMLIAVTDGREKKGDAHFVVSPDARVPHWVSELRIGNAASNGNERARVS